MAFKEIKSATSDAIELGPKNTRIEGYLSRLTNVYPPKKEGDNPTVIIHINTASAGLMRLFASYVIRDVLLTSDFKVKPEFMDKKVRLTWLGKIKLKGIKTMNDIKIEVDMDDQVS